MLCTASRAFRFMTIIARAYLKKVMIFQLSFCLILKTISHDKFYAKFLGNHNGASLFSQTFSPVTRDIVALSRDRQS